MSHGSDSHGSMSRIDTIFPSLSKKAIDSGISVFFIQKPPLLSSKKRKAIPQSSGNASRCMSPNCCASSESATSRFTSTESSPVSIRARAAGKLGDGEGSGSDGSHRVPFASSATRPAALHPVRSRIAAITRAASRMEPSVSREEISEERTDRQQREPRQHAQDQGDHHQHGSA